MRASDLEVSELESRTISREPMRSLSKGCKRASRRDSSRAFGPRRGRDRGADHRGGLAQSLPSVQPMKTRHDFRSRVGHEGLRDVDARRGFRRSRLACPTTLPWQRFFRRTLIPKFGSLIFFRIRRVSPPGLLIWEKMRAHFAPSSVETSRDRGSAAAGARVGARGGA